ncbi:MAG: rRNA maturation RNase YbeY [Candidatus Accumulibacter sp.]|uniref:Endoribonuclease YbeY n=1 Tax=Candidatus Accumulibacter affinis TaxID=2954384 RepID=A0A935W7U6_9PROT|nr:rRNA maturation RNase YbeY [Candidatus Accumulibacter affinis]
MAKGEWRLRVSVQRACDSPDLPGKSQVRNWARAAVAPSTRGGQITVRFVDSEEGQRLNRDYRARDYATNVLSFPYQQAPLLCGDLVLCAPVVAREATAQDKSCEAHYAHLIVHGMLHLQGYDHEAGEEEARDMEDRERRLLAALGFPDPYREEE